MNIKNKDVIKSVGTRNLAKILGCSESTINNWTKKGLGKRQEKMSTFNDIACNKVNGIRCAKVDSVKDVLATRNDNDTQIVAFGESKTLEEALELVLTFITTPCSMEEKHVRRRNKVINYEVER